MAVRDAKDRPVRTAFEDFEEMMNGRAHENGKPKTCTAADLMALELPPVRWAVPRVLPEGVTLFAGKPKLGKSWLTLGLGVATATGGVALGKVRVEQGPCLYWPSKTTAADYRSASTSSWRAVRHPKGSTSLLSGRGWTRAAWKP